MQGFIVFLSLFDFSIFTLSFIYGLVIAFASMPLKERIMPVVIGLLFLVLRAFYLPFLIILIPIKRIWYPPQIIFIVSCNFPKNYISFAILESAFC